MIRNLVISALIGLLGLSLHGCKWRVNTTIHDEFKPFYTEQQVEGCCMIYDPQRRVAHAYNPSVVEQQFTPASTFKIFNSLVGLETGIIPNIQYEIPWDSVLRANQAWNSDHDLQKAFKNSTVWYYQELARRVGPLKMQYWLQKAKYGNADTSGGIDQFWLKGGLRISVKEQIRFL
jgi:beta-lactamase class D